jgi:hypothetical protein
MRLDDEAEEVLDLAIEAVDRSEDPLDMAFLAGAMSVGMLYAIELEDMDDELLNRRVTEVVAMLEDLPLVVSYQAAQILRRKLLV